MKNETVLYIYTKGSRFSIMVLNVVLPYFAYDMNSYIYGININIQKRWQRNIRFYEYRIVSIWNCDRCEHLAFFLTFDHALTKLKALSSNCKVTNAWPHPEHWATILESICSTMVAKIYFDCRFDLTFYIADISAPEQTVERAIETLVI